MGTNGPQATRGRPRRRTTRGEPRERRVDRRRRRAGRGRDRRRDRDVPRAPDRPPGPFAQINRRRGGRERRAITEGAERGGAQARGKETSAGKRRRGGLAGLTKEASPSTETKGRSSAPAARSDPDPDPDLRPSRKRGGKKGGIPPLPDLTFGAPPGSAGSRSRTGCGRHAGPQSTRGESQKARVGCSGTERVGLWVNDADENRGAPGVSGGVERSGRSERATGTDRTGSGAQLLTRSDLSTAPAPRGPWTRGSHSPRHRRTTVQYKPLASGLRAVSSGAPPTSFSDAEF